MRGTGGNRFIPPTASQEDLLDAIWHGLTDLRNWANETGRVFDLAEVTVNTKRTNSGAISVTVEADLQGGAS